MTGWPLALDHTAAVMIDMCILAAGIFSFGNFVLLIWLLTTRK